MAKSYSVTADRREHRRLVLKKNFEGRVATATRVLLGALGILGVRTEGENFRDTPERVGRAWGEMFSGLVERDEQVKEILSKTFPLQGRAPEMVTCGPIRVWSMCPHHLLPVEMRVWVSYIPRSRGKVLGISKLARLAELLAKKPALQEATADEIADTLYNELAVAGTGCVIRGRHLCMAMRGAKKEAVVTTTSLRGTYLEKTEVRQEFLDTVRADW